MDRTGLELQAERELNVALGAALSAGDSSEVGVLLISIRSVELGGVGDVRAFGAELEGDAFGKRKVLKDREVQSPGGRSHV